MLSKLPPNFDEGQWREMFGSGQPDLMIRQAIQYCWMMLPKEKKTVKDLEGLMRMLLERALQNFREDMKTFGEGT
jgi:hypothetical protein